MKFFALFVLLLAINVHVVANEVRDERIDQTLTSMHGLLLVQGVQLTKLQDELSNVTKTLYLISQQAFKMENKNDREKIQTILADQESKIKEITGSLEIQALHTAANQYRDAVKEDSVGRIGLIKHRLEFSLSWVGWVSLATGALVGFYSFLSGNAMHLVTIPMNRMSALLSSYAVLGFNLLLADYLLQTPGILFRPLEDISTVFRTIEEAKDFFEFVLAERKKQTFGDEFFFPIAYSLIFLAFVANWRIIHAEYRYRVLAHDESRGGARFNWDLLLRMWPVFTSAATSVVGFFLNLRIYHIAFIPAVALMYLMGVSSYRNHEDDLRVSLKKLCSTEDGFLELRAFVIEKREKESNRK